MSHLFRKALTVDLHLDFLFQFPPSTGHSAQVRVLILKAHGAQCQCGRGPRLPHLPVKGAVYLSPPRKSGGVTANNSACQYN